MTLLNATRYYQHDAVGNVTRTIDRNGRITRYEYDNLYRQTKETWQETQVGDKVKGRYANTSGTQLVATSTYGYDGTGRLASLAHTKSTTTLAGYTWTWDAANRIDVFTNTQIAGETVDYGYDNSGQLTGANYSTQTDETYDYDDNGNRLTANGDTYATGENNQLDDDDTYTYEYDREGNIIKRTETASGDYRIFEWDHRNRLSSVSDYDDQDTPLLKVSYTYDAFDRLIGRQVDEDIDGIDATEAFVYDGDQIVLQFGDNDAADLAASDLTHRYLWGPNVDMLLADESVSSLGSAGTVSWALGDHLNTVRDVVRYSGGSTTIVNHNTYDSFGGKLSQSSASDDVAFGHTGRYDDPDTGLRYHHHRWSDAATGRWISQDPIGFSAGDTNLYRDRGNSPTNSIDP